MAQGQRELDSDQATGACKFEPNKKRKGEGVGVDKKTTNKTKKNQAANHPAQRDFPQPGGSGDCNGDPNST